MASGQCHNVALSNLVPDNTKCQEFLIKKNRSATAGKSKAERTGTCAGVMGTTLRLSESSAVSVISGDIPRIYG